MIAPRRLLTALLVSFLLLVPSAEAGVGGPRLDASFGHGGRIEPAYPSSLAGAYFTSANVGGDGSLLVTRQDTYNGSGSVSEARYLADGRPDPSFKSVQKEELPEAVDAKGRTLRVLPTLSDEAFQRLNPDGSVDTTLGAGEFEEPRSKAVEFVIEAILPLPSGKIVVAGTVGRPREGSEGGTEVALAMYDEAGQLDPGFGAGGVVDLGKEDGAAGEELVALTSGPGEDALVVLNDESTVEKPVPVVHSGSRVVAVGGNGRLDPGFGAAGTFGTADAIGAVEALPGGGLLIAGDHWRPGPTAFVGTADVYLTRLTAAGAPDPIFGQGGTTTVDIDAVDLAHSVLMRPDGSIVVGGDTTTSPLECPQYGSSFCKETPILVGFTPSGAVDPGFGESGVVRLRSLAFEFAPVDGLGVLLLRNLPGGGILAGGGTQVAAFLAELDSHGRLETGFGNAGIVTATHPHKALSTLKTMVADPAGGILALGNTDAGGQSRVAAGTVFRFGPNGAVDRGFGDGDGYVKLPGRMKGFAVDRQGRGLVLSEEGGGDFVTRLTPDGRLDRSFGIEGVAPLPKGMQVTVKGRKVILSSPLNLIAALAAGGVLIPACATGGPSRIGLIRLTAAGRPDPSFGRDGQVLVDLGKTGDCGATRALETLPGGGIVLGGAARTEIGRSRQTAAVIRLNPDGSLDRAFGVGGLATVPLPGHGLVSALAIGPRGEILAAGRLIDKKKSGPLVARLSATGRLDRGFVERAARTLRGPADDRSSPRQILLTAGRILVSGYQPSVLTYSAAGRFEGSLVLGTERKPRTEARAATLQRGKLVVATKTVPDPGFTLRRFLLSP